MQTRRDQLQAYRFQNRRALAALITGEPNVVDPPMRRLTITTLSGVMIAVLVTVGFTLFGLIKPKAGDSWKEAGAIIVELDTGATYVYSGDTLYPVVNYTSAVLAVGRQQPAKIVEVNSSDIASAKRKPQIGIPGLPSTLPDEDDLQSSPVTACSRLQVVSNNQVGVQVSVHFDAVSGRGVPAADGVLVRTQDQTYLLVGGHRHLIAGERTTAALGYGDRTPLRVGSSFVTAVPQGADLRPPAIPGAGSPATALTGLDAVVGQLIETPDGDAYVAMADGRYAVTDVQRSLLEALPIDGKVQPAITASKSTVLNLPESKTWPQLVSDELAGLPDEVPDIVDTPTTAGGLCAVFTDGSDEPRLTVPASRLPSFQSSAITETTTSRDGRADVVVVSPGRAALVREIGTGQTIYLVGDSGKKFAVTDNEILPGFGYETGDAAKLPAALLAMISDGPALDRTDALRPVRN